MILALASPLDALSDDYLFTAHMVQHNLLTLIAPPLLLAGIPGWLVDFLVRNPAVKKAARLRPNKPQLVFSCLSKF